MVNKLGLQIPSLGVVFHRTGVVYTKVLCDTSLGDGTFFSLFYKLEKVVGTLISWAAYPTTAESALRTLIENINKGKN